MKTSAYRLRNLPLLLSLPLLVISFPLSAQEDSALAAAPQAKQVWHLSNASGLVLGPVSSRIIALRNKYCLSMGIIPAASLPAIIRAYYDPVYIIDFRTLYEDGKPARQQWVFRDGNMARLNAAAAVTETGPAFAFIERYDRNGFLQEERQFSDEGEIAISYIYRDETLVRAETHVKAQQVAKDQPELVETAFYIDYYEYSRSASLRAVRRVFQKGTTGDAVRISFPSIRLHPQLDTGFVKPSVAYGSAFIDEAVPVEQGANIVYDVDKKGRIAKETLSDSEGAVTGEMKNNWAGDRITSVERKNFDKDGKVTDEKYTEYQYDQKGDHIAELNYNNGVLERTVKKSGNQEIEELYMNGKVVLRAIWEGGKKVKEERVK